MDLIGLAQDRDSWLALVDAAANLRVAQNVYWLAGKLLNSQ